MWRCNHQRRKLIRIEFIAYPSILQRVINLKGILLRPMDYVGVLLRQMTQGQQNILPRTPRTD
jgi:hypothetical protein